jgi:hypothetical protein
VAASAKASVRFAEVVVLYYCSFERGLGGAVNWWSRVTASASSNSSRVPLARRRVVAGRIRPVAAVVVNLSSR